MISDCCGCEVVLEDICRKCGEHCEPTNDEIMVDENGVDWIVGYGEDEPDYIPGLDDGEGWDPVMGDAEDHIETDDQWLDDFCGEEDFA